MDNDTSQCHHSGMIFRKYHGTGNDFLVVDARQGRPAGLTPDIVKQVCDRHFGVGGDGILLIETGDVSPWFMRVLNSDGTQAEMCGNGIRCVARFIAEHLWTGPRPDQIPIQTAAGIRLCRLSYGADGLVESVAVSMGAPRTDKPSVPLAGNGSALNVPITAGGRQFVGNGVSMGNPHFVVFEYLQDRQAEHFGAALGADPMFPVGANIEFAEKVAADHFRLVVYERGCGLTLACGTGASATVTAAVLNGMAIAGVPVRVDLPGGPLKITVAADLSDVTLEGPAVEVFMGEIDLTAFRR